MDSPYHFKSILNSLVESYALPCDKRQDITNLIHSYPKEYALYLIDCLSVSDVMEINYYYRGHIPEVYYKSSNEYCLYRIRNGLDRSTLDKPFVSESETLSGSTPKDSSGSTSKGLSRKASIDSSGSTIKGSSGRIFKWCWKCL